MYHIYSSWVGKNESYPWTDSSQRRTLGPPALHLAVVKFLGYLPLVSGGTVSVRVQLHLPLGPAFASGVARVLLQVVIVVLVVKGLFERGQSLQIRGHDFSSFEKQQQHSVSKQMTQPVFIYAWSRDHAGARASWFVFLALVLWGKINWGIFSVEIVLKRKSIFTSKQVFKFVFLLCTIQTWKRSGSQKQTGIITCLQC